MNKDSEVWNNIGVPALVEYTAPDGDPGYHIPMFRPRKALLHGSYLLRALQTTAITAL
jgi:type I restriction enzyme, S subunit